MYFISYLMKEFRKMGFIICNMSVMSCENDDPTLSLYYNSAKMTPMKHSISRNISFKCSGRRLCTRQFRTMGDGIDI